MKNRKFTTDRDFNIYEKPATQVDIRYQEVGAGMTPSERSVRIDWEGRSIGVFAPVSTIDARKETIRVRVWDVGRKEILFELPGDDMNATGRRLWASRE